MTNARERFEDKVVRLAREGVPLSEEQAALVSAVIEFARDTCEAGSQVMALDATR